LTPVHHIAVRNYAGPHLDTELALTVEAIRSELPTFCRHWSLPIPGIAYYGDDRSLAASPGERALLCVVSSTGDPSAFARHSQLGSTIYSYVDEQTCKAGGEPIPRAASHEIWELCVDPDLTRTFPQPDGTEVLAECSDPPNRISLPTEASFYGRSGVVPLSNYVLPAWYVPGSEGPWDRCGVLTGPLQDGPWGYHQVQRGGVVIASGAAMRLTSFGRSYRRMAGAPSL
jgi:hypothetical protein